MKQLTKQSSEAEIKAYFCAVLNLAKSNEEFPVNLDDVWPLVYTEKGKAVRALKSNDLFMEGVDYISLAQNDKQDSPLAQNGKRLASGKFNGENKVTYMLSVPCLEFFIARKVRPVFEVYRQVFHKVAEGKISPRQSFDIAIRSHLLTLYGSKKSLLFVVLHFHFAFCVWVRRAGSARRHR